MENKFFRLKRMKAQVKQFAPVLFLIVALALTGIGVSNNPILIRVRTAATDAFVPILSVLYTPVRWVKDLGNSTSELFSIRDENKRLRAENASLRLLQNKVYQLTSDNQKLAQLLNYQPAGEKHFVTARIVADNGGAFSKSVLVQSGTVDGVKKGDLALTELGVLGRVIEVGSLASRVLLITDYTSRIPVKVGEAGTLAILSGDNTVLLKLIALSEEADIKIGDLVMTSGHSGVYPAGLSLGTVAAMEKGEIYVQPFSERDKAEFVRLVNFGLDGLLPQTTCAEE